MKKEKRTNPYDELAKLPAKQRAKIQREVLTAKKTVVYRVKGFKDKNFNVKDIYWFNPTKHIALIQTKSAKEFLLIKDLVYLKNVGYGKLVENYKKDKKNAVVGYWDLSDSLSADVLDDAEESSKDFEKEENIEAIISM